MIFCHFVAHATTKSDIGSFSVGHSVTLYVVHNNVDSNVAIRFYSESIMSSYKCFNPPPPGPSPRPETRNDIVLTS